MPGFQFKQFRVEHGRCGQKVTSDACLFGAFVAASLKKSKSRTRRVLDVGAGSGLLSLMLAQELAADVVDAVEVAPESAQQCAENFRDSPWSDRLRVHETNIQRYRSDERYDVIISNPPFFANRPVTPQSPEKARATHQSELPLADLADAARGLLDDAGHFFVLLPDYEQALLGDLARDLTPHRLAAIRATPSKKPHLTVARYSASVRSGNDDEEELLTVFRDDVARPNRYHATFAHYLHPFYLWL